MTSESSPPSSFPAGDAASSAPATTTTTTTATLTPSLSTDQPPPPSDAPGTTTTTTNKPVPKKAPRRIIRRRGRGTGGADRPLVDPQLVDRVLRESGLPMDSYSFEVTKTVQRITELRARHVGLQMPEGLLLYATVLADVLVRLCHAVNNNNKNNNNNNDNNNDNNDNTATPLQVSILGDVTYGACCLDDLGARAMGMDLLVHYGHSCLVPIPHSAVPVLYVFLEIQIDVPHLVECLVATLVKNKKPRKLYLLGTIQFRHALGHVQQLLRERWNSNDKNTDDTTTTTTTTEIVIPQVKPLSPGEVLGCTSPQLPGLDNNDNNDDDAVVLFVADGRFHLEATLIANPHIPLFLRYDPYGKVLTRERYAHDQLHHLRQTAIQAASTATTFGLILGTLGRQGNPAVLQTLQQLLRKHGKRYFVLLLSEITPAKLALFDHTRVQAWVQVACPRLSIDWGHALSTQPVLTPYELHVALRETTYRSVYPMDYYAQTPENPLAWNNYHPHHKARQYTNQPPVAVGK